MEFRLLGPLEAVENGRPLALGGHKQRALLAVLLLHANDVVPTERLIDELWGESPPATVAKSVQVYVSRLRKQLGADRLVTREPGYVLEVGPSELDVRCFERLVAQARADEPHAAGTRLREALALWRGPPLADLAYEPFAQPEIARLEELRLATLEERFEVDLATGRHAEIVGELDALISEHPLRERLRRQQMLALYRSGRQAEALEAYRRTRSTLIDELGIEPGHELRRLEQAILDQDASLDAGPQSAPERVHRGSGFVGRKRELDVLERALTDAAAGRGRLVLIAGEPGIGKSRLSEELLDRARAGGAQVLAGRCWEAGGAPAYWPWVQALRSYVRTVEPGRLQAELGSGAVDVAQILPELQELFPDLPEPQAPDSEGARFRLFDAVTAFLSAASRTQPLVLLLDDVHAADETSLLLLRFMAREIAGRRLLVICAYRDVDPTIRDPLSSALAELVREPHTVQISLAGLSEDDVASYIELTTGVVPAAPLVAAIHAETEGNSLFVGEVVRLLDDQQRVADTDAHLSIPPGVRVVIRQRVERLSERCRDLLSAASVMGREFDLDALAALSETPRDGLLDVVDEALGERILGVAPGAPGRLRFGHALIRDTLYDELTSARRLRLHQFAGEALEAVYAGDLDPHLAELAKHFYAAAQAGSAGKAIDYARRAGDRAVTQLAYEEAVRQYERGLSLADQTAERCDLLLGLGAAHARSGDSGAAKRVYDEAAKLAAAAGLNEQLAHAALGYGGRIIWEVSRDDEQLIPLLERALRALGEDDSALRVRLLARLAGGPLRDARFPVEQSTRMTDEALEMARRVDDPATLAYALLGNINGHLSPDHVQRRLELSTELIEVALQAGDPERLLDGHSERSEALLELGRKREADAELDAMGAVARTLRQPSQDWFVCAHHARMALLEGRLQDAETLIAQARAQGAQAQGWNATVTYGLQLYALRREQGRLAEIEQLVRRSSEDYPTYPIWRCVAAQSAAALGRSSEAADALAALAQDDFARLPFDEEWLVSLCLLADTACALGDRDHADALYRRLLPYRKQVAVSCQEITTGAVARNLGLLAALIDRGDQAARHFDRALEVNARVGARAWLARTQVDCADFLLTRAGGEQLERAASLRAAAHATYEELGMAA